MDNSTIEKARHLVEGFAAARKRDPLPRDVAAYMQNSYDLATEVLAWVDAGLAQAGTHAYEMLAAYAKADADTIESLIQMVAATVLYKLIDEEGGGRANVTFSPADMDTMFREYMLDSTRDGLLTTVRIKPREGSKHGAESEIGASHPVIRLYRQDEDPSNAKPQVEAKIYDRPFWVIRYFAPDERLWFAVMHDRADAERHLGEYTYPDLAPPTIENRFCTHLDCPTERCNHTEVTSS